MMTNMHHTQEVDPSEEVDADLAQSTSFLRLEQEQPEAQMGVIPHAEVSLADLLASLPPLISYTPVSVPLTSNTSTPSLHRTILRRDLFDARFQVLSQDSDSDEDQQENAAEPAHRSVMVDETSDLVKGVYEGGLKTWECSLDLVDCLDGMGYGAADDGKERVRGKGVLEIGCGTALPSCSVFMRLINEIRRNPSKGSSRKPTRLHFQDYNKQVLSLITLPNLLLAYAHHLATSSDDKDLPPGDIEVTPEFLDSFEELLISEAIELRFFVGDWSGMEILPHERYDLVLTSETIYAVPSLPPLLKLLKAACLENGKTECLVACKRIYFGVGGGELEFKRRIAEMAAEVKTVWGEGKGQGKDRGVGRVVMSVTWC